MQNFHRDGIIRNVTPQWDDFTFILHDMIGASTTQEVYSNLLENQVLGFREQFKLEMLDPVGTVIERWLIIGYVTRIDFSNVDYSSDDLAEVKITIHPENCTLVF